MIHEGTHGIQALDLLGRKVVMDGGAGFELLGTRVGATIACAAGIEALAAQASTLAAAWPRRGAATRAAWATGEPEEALANATPYLQAFGHTVLAWTWLELALAAQAALDARPDAARSAFCRGKLQAARYFFHYELPKIDAWLGVVAARDATCRAMDEAWF